MITKNKKIVDDIFKDFQPAGTMDVKENARKQAADDIEDLRQHDTLNEEDAVEYTTETMDAQRMKSQLRREEYVSFLSSISLSNPSEYKDLLAQYGNNEVRNLDLRKGWKLVFTATKLGDQTIAIGKASLTPQDGILVVLRSPDGTKYARPVSVMYEADVDLNAIHVLLIQAENTVDKMTGQMMYSDDPKTDSNPPSFILS